jgi:flagellar basal-body rod protein FlgC
MPNINVVEEMTNMITATRAYEANVTAFTATKNMLQQALQI